MQNADSNGFVGYDFAVQHAIRMSHGGSDRLSEGSSMDHSYLRRSFPHRYRVFSPPSLAGKPSVLASLRYSSQQSYPYLPPPPPLPPPEQLPCLPPPRHYMPAPPPPPSHLPYEPRRCDFTQLYLSQPSPLPETSSRFQLHGPSQSPWGLYGEEQPDARGLYTTRGYNHLFDRRTITTNRPVDRFSHNLECGYSRYRDESGGRKYARVALERGRTTENHHPRGHVALDFDRSSRVLGFGNRAEDSNSALGHGMMFGISNDRGSQILNCERFERDGRGKLVDIAHNGIVSSSRDGKYAQGSDSFSIEKERFTNNGSRVVNRGLNQSPPKQGLKKSVLLRLQDPKLKRKVRDDEWLHSTGHLEERKPLSLKSKDHHQLSHSEQTEKQREATPVELDVSFKSNTLVAKAILTPDTADSSLGKTVSPQIKKFRKLMQTDYHRKTSPSGDSTKSGKMRFSDMDICANSSVKHQEKIVADHKSSMASYPKSCVSGVSDDKKLGKPPVTTCLRINRSATTDQKNCDSPKVDTQKAKTAAQSATKPPRAGKTYVQPASNDTSSTLHRGFISDAGKFPAAEVIKKKMVKKHVPKKRARKVPSNLKSTQRAEKFAGLGKPTGNSSYNASSNNKSLQKNSFVHALGSPSSLAKGSLLMEAGKKNSVLEDPKAVEIDISIESGEEHLCEMKRERNSSKFPLGSSFHERPIVSEAAAPLDKLANNDENSVKPLIESTFKDVTNGEVDDNHVLLKGKSLLPETSTTLEYPNIRGNNTDTCVRLAEGSNEEQYLAAQNHILDKGNDTISFNSQDGNHDPQSEVCSARVKHNVENGGTASVGSSPGREYLENLSSESSFLPLPTSKSTEVLPGSGSAGVFAVTSFRELSNCKSYGLERTLDYHNDLNYSARMVYMTDNTGKDILQGEVAIFPKTSTVQGSSDAISLQESDECMPDSSRSQILNSQLDCCQNLKEDSMEILVVNGHTDGIDETVGARNSCNTGIFYGDARQMDAGSINCSVSEQPFESGLLSDKTLGPGSKTDSDYNNYQCQEGIRLLDFEAACLDGSCIALPKNCSGGGSLNADSKLSDEIYVSCGQRENLSNDNVDIASGNLDDEDKDDLSEVGGSVEKLLYADEKNGITCKSEQCQISEVDLLSENSFNPGHNSLGASGVLNENETNESSQLSGRMLPVEIDSIKGVNLAEVVNLSKTSQCYNTVEGQYSPIPEKLTSRDRETGESAAHKYLELTSDLEKTPIEKSADDLLDYASDIPFDVESQKILTDAIGKDNLNSEVACFSTSNQHSCEDNRNLSDSHGVDVASDPKISLNPDADVPVDVDSVKDAPLVSGSIVNFRSNAKTMNSGGEVIRKKRYTGYTIPKGYLSSVGFNASKNVVPRIRSNTSRTWHRTDNSLPLPVKPFSCPIPPEVPLLKKAAVFQNSYIRKGNSLHRKPPLEGAGLNKAPHGQNLLINPATDCTTAGKKDTGAECRMDTSNAHQCPFTRSATPFNGSKLPNHDSVTSTLVSSPSHEYLTSDQTETADDCNEYPEITNYIGRGVRTSETSDQMGKGSEEQNEVANDVAGLGGITYIKRKSNQLVAARNTCNSREKQVSSDRYYKRSSNQLIRTPADSHSDHVVLTSKNALDAKGSETISRQSSERDAAKFLGCYKSPLVWRLQGTGPKKTSSFSLHDGKMLPQLFPWKRPTYSRSPLGKFHSISGPPSSIGRKLLLLRNRGAIYTRSNYGYSLRKSKVLSIGRPHLKWSKSIERNSKRANEEATLAVAAAVKKNLEGVFNVSGVSGMKTKSRSSRERVYRIGSFRYKMDPSRRTLRRISENDSSNRIVPRRLLIGTDEYVRIGNGNQLVRDPKKRTRTLASEKVRWSLHTARLRLARKRKYCQFFTRFGKCNKDDGKCPYLHDPSKVTVCTKFLNGLCANPSCKLTHKVIPERMPDCSYFLQGLCTNEMCPYRHVHVNPKAGTCEAFLRGYCADGNECRKKHSYMCPIFETTGSCPQESKCKLHHPKKQGKRRKRKRSTAQGNGRGRYFESLHNGTAGSETIVFDGHSKKGESNSGGLGGDYISLEDGKSSVIEGNDNYFFELKSKDLDELIKPMRIMSQKW